MIPLQYIDVTGNQQIDTDVTPSNTLRIRVDLAPTASNENGFFGSAWSERGFFLMGYRGSWRFHSGGVVTNDGSVGTDRVVVDASTTFLTVGETVYSFTSSGNTGTTVYLFSIPRTQGGPGTCRFYACQMWDGETLLRDFIPATVDGVTGLWDRVSETLFTNTGAGSFTPGPAAIPYFTVQYNAAGGSGSMADQVINLDTPTALTQNAFAREDYSFSGWATEQGGPVVYTDGEIVENLAGDGETVELFAVWTALPPRFLLQFNPTDNEHLDKDLQTIHDLHGYFRDGCSVEDPVVLLAIDPADLAGVNYFTIPALRRGYFLTGQTVVRTGLVEISGHVDVLSSFATEIRQQRAIVRRAQSSDAFNLYLNDGSLKSYQNPYILTELFPNGFTGQSFILSVAGSSTPPSGT